MGQVMMDYEFKSKDFGSWCIYFADFNGKIIEKVIRSVDFTDFYIYVIDHIDLTDETFIYALTPDGSILTWPIVEQVSEDDGELIEKCQLNLIST